MPQGPDHRRDAALAPARDHRGATEDTTRTHHPALGLALAPHQDDPAHPPAVVSTATRHRDPRSSLRDGEGETRRLHDRAQDRAHRLVEAASGERAPAPAPKVDPTEVHPLPRRGQRQLDPLLSRLNNLHRKTTKAEFTLRDGEWSMVYVQDQDQEQEPLEAVADDLALETFCRLIWRRLDA